MQENWRKNAPKKENFKKVFFKKVQSLREKKFVGSHFFRCTFSEIILQIWNQQKNSGFFLHPYWPSLWRKKSLLYCFDKKILNPQYKSWK
jgi:hypothetical protein